VPVAETTVNQRQLEIAALRAQIGSTGAIADGLNNRIVTMERGSAIIDQDLHEIVRLAEGKVTLGSISHAGGSITMTGTASDTDDIFDYARALRAGGRFSEVWISSINGGGGGFSFEFSLTK
jgi:Tfp pilus assembly protein PilN